MICTRCNCDKPESEFHIRRRAKSGRASACRQCVSTYKRENQHLQRSNRERNPEDARRRYKDYRAKNRDKINARNRLRYQQTKHRIPAYYAVRAALKSGDLVRPFQCSKCQDWCDPQAHHEDYNKPLEVVWLCSRCHRRHHTYMANKLREKGESDG